MSFAALLKIILWQYFPLFAVYIADQWPRKMKLEENLRMIRAFIVSNIRQRDKLTR